MAEQPGKTIPEAA